MREAKRLAGGFEFGVPALVGGLFERRHVQVRGPEKVPDHAGG